MPSLRGHEVFLKQEEPGEKYGGLSGHGSRLSPGDSVDGERTHRSVSETTTVQDL